jgi:hypothetical protein
VIRDRAQRTGGHAGECRLYSVASARLGLGSDAQVADMSTLAVRISIHVPEYSSNYLGLVGHPRA